MTKFAIIGSRRFPESCKHQVSQVVFEYYMDSGSNGISRHVLVSGGAKGPDTWGEQAADEMGLQKLIFPAKWQEQCHPNCQPIRRGDWFYYRHAGFERNTLIAREASIGFAFVVDERGGTWDTIRKMRAMGKPVYVAYPGKELHVL